MYNTSQVPNYTLGLSLQYRDGDLWIAPDAAIGSIAGCRIVAVQLTGQEPIHLTELTEGTAVRTLISPIGELRDSKTVILHIDNFRMGKRQTLTVERFQPRR